MVDATSACARLPLAVSSRSTTSLQTEKGKNSDHLDSHRRPRRWPTRRAAAPRLTIRNTFTCIPDTVTFGPARLTPKPFVQGIQTAVVVGPAGEEIYPDEYGRVKVQFHWDREGKKDENSSCWIRVAQSGRQEWGFIAIPRIGQEVVVDFLEGDPDRPLITGAVHNAEQMPHYELPDDKNKVYFKTNSTKGGDGYNELMFDDTDDEERLFLHAQKNMDTRVLNDSKARPMAIAIRSSVGRKTVKRAAIRRSVSGKISTSTSNAISRNTLKATWR